MSFFTLNLISPFACICSKVTSRDQKSTPTKKPRAFGLSYLVTRTSTMVPLHMAGFPGKHKGSLSNFTAPILTAAREVIYSVLIIANAEVSTVFILVNILPIFSAFPNHVGINIGDSLHSTNSDVFSRQQTCHQRNPKHYILRIRNCYIVADHFWCQVSFACKDGLISKETVVLPERESQTLKFRVNADINNHL